MIVDWTALLLQSGVKFWDIIYDELVVSIEVCSTINGNSHHSEIISDYMKCFNSCLHFKKLSAKASYLYFCVTFWVLVNKDCVDEETGLGVFGVLVSCMVKVYKHAYIDCFAQWFWGTSWYRLFDVNIECFPTDY